MIIKVTNKEIKAIREFNLSVSSFGTGSIFGSAKTEHIVVENNTNGDVQVDILEDMVVDFLLISIKIIARMKPVIVAIKGLIDTTNTLGELFDSKWFPSKPTPVENEVAE